VQLEKRISAKPAIANLQGNGIPKRDLKVQGLLSEEMPENHEPPVCEVTTTNAHLSPSIMRTLENNPKFRIVNEDFDYYTLPAYQNLGV
jgi:hypothetical protein